MSNQETEKATRYIGLLNSARLNGSWGEVPELVRKVDKHAPHRKCLTCTASTEAQIATAGRARPVSSISSTSNTAPLDLAPNLEQYVGQAQSFPEDAFQASICLMQIHYVQGDWAAVLGAVRQDLWRQTEELTRRKAETSGCTRLCIVKGRYMLGLAQEQNVSKVEAMMTYASAVPIINETPKDIATSSEYRSWAERILARACVLHAQDGSPATVGQVAGALPAFRAWAIFWETASPQTSTGNFANLAKHDIPRRRVWSLYYELLSSFLQKGLVYTDSPQTPVGPSNGFSGARSSRLRQRTEFKRVQATYETLLLQETRFPKATESNTETEQWANAAVANWRVTTGPTWRESDLEEGGKDAVGRGILDILYRAATKTFHSTPILRHLFTVHAALGDFDLAMRAFDTYTEIITNGKARAEKTGEHELGLDSDDLVIYTAAEAINILCLYGSRDQGEQALQIGRKTARFLQSKRPHSPESIAPNGGDVNSSEKMGAEEALSRSALAIGYRAIGQSEANWARYTYEPSQRTELQKQALLTLRKSADLGGVAGTSPETAYFLALALAGTRDITAAIQVLRAALVSPTRADEDESVAVGPMEDLSRERRLTHLWHLLALLLSAKGDFETAVQMCEAAFEQLVQAATALGNSHTAGDAQIQQDETDVEPSLEILNDILSGQEKERLVQIKMTEIELLALLDAPNTAVDRSRELLTLYAHLFGDPGTVPDRKLPASAATTQAPPKPSTGTLRSLKGSILRKNKTPRRSLEEQTFQANQNENSSPYQASNTSQAVVAPVAVPATQESGQSGEHHHRLHIPHHPFKHLGHHHDGTHESSMVDPTLTEKTGTYQQQPPAVPLKDNPPFPTTQTAGVDGAISASAISQGHMSPDQPFSSIPHNIDHEKEPPPLGHTDQPPPQDIRLPAPHPAIAQMSASRLPSAQQKRQSVSLLVDIWLYVANMYIREDLFEDALAAIDEAVKLVETFQIQVAQEHSSARAFDERGWGVGRSVGRLWADVWAQRGNLAAAQHLPHEALAHFEQALSNYPDHPDAIIGISSFLFDMYEQKTSAEPSSPPSPPDPQHSSAVTTAVPSSVNTHQQNTVDSQSPNKPSPSPATRFADPSPAELNRLAARDRGYMLLDTLTKLGSGWDNPEAWFALSRAYELSGQVEKAKECLWWVVELEDTRPIRPWSCAGGFFA